MAAIGSTWKSGTWTTPAWAANTWRNAVATPYQCGVYYFPGWSMPGGGPFPSDPWFVIPDDRIPLTLGKFDETQQSVVDTELTWMHQYGVTFVAIDWFMQWSGTTLQPFLDHFITKYLSSVVAKPKVCVQFANQTNAGGLNASVAHKVYDYWIANYFTDPNYLTIGGKKVVIVNSGPSLRGSFASNAEVTAFLNAGDAAAASAGQGGIYWMVGQGDSSSAWSDVSTPAFGWSGVTGSNIFKTTKVSDNSAGPSPATFADLDNAVFSGLVNGYRGFCYGWLNAAGINVFWPPLTAGYDETPWNPSTTLHGMPTSAEWGAHLAKGKALIDANAIVTQKTFMVEAFTEFGEGSMLAPNKGNAGFDRMRQMNTVFALNPAAIMVPDPFSFNAVIGATPNTVYTSNTITTDGINVTGDYFVTGAAQVSKNGGAYSNNPGTFVAGDTFALRLTSSPLINIPVSGELSLSGISATYTVITAAGSSGVVRKLIRPSGKPLVKAIGNR